MPQKVLHVFFRHKFLILLPAVLLVLAGGIASLQNQEVEYSSTAKVWTQRTPLLSSRLGGQGSSFIPPASHQARVVNDLLALDSFRRAVAERVPEIHHLPEGQQLSTVRRGTAVFGSGMNVLNIRHVGDDPVIAQAIVQGIIDAYSETFHSNVIAEAGVAADFYEERLADARQRLEEAKAALAEYQASVASSEPADSASPVVSGDDHAAALMAEARDAQGEYDAILSRLEDIHQQRDAALKGRDLSFQVMDSPSLPSHPIPTPKTDLLLLPLLGLLLGISASAGVLFALTRLDGTIRFPSEAEGLGVPVLAVVPKLPGQKKSSGPRNAVRLVVAAARGLMG